ncbi:MAG: O-antigen ligase family protein [Gemmatimonadales bacterium]
MASRLSGAAWPAGLAAAPPPVATAPWSAAAPAAAAQFHPLVVGLFYILIASLPIEIPERTFRWEVPTITATFFLLATFLQPVACYRRTHAGLLWLLVYLHVFVISALWHGWPDTIEIAQLFLFLVQATLVAWATFNLMHDDAVARKALWWFVAACVVRTILPMLGIERSTLTEHATGAQRITAFGQDANYSAMLLGAALLITIGLTHGPSRTTLRARLVAYSLALFFALAIANTGSRGGLLALVTGLVAFAFQRARTPLERMRSTLIVVVSMIVLTYVVMNSYVMRKRIETTKQQGAMAGREELFPALWGMFLERPVDGWGPMNNQYEVAKRATRLILRPEQVAKDTHNLFLEVLTATGLLGAVPFFLALALCVRAAWRARPGGYGILPLALIGLFLVANLSLNQVVHKPFWVFMAFVFASESRLLKGPAGRER